MIKRVYVKCLGAQRCPEAQGLICGRMKITINYGAKCGTIFSLENSLDELVPPNYPAKDMQVFCQAPCQRQKDNYCQRSAIILSSGGSCREVKGNTFEGGHDGCNRNFGMVEAV